MTFPHPPNDSVHATNGTSDNSTQEQSLNLRILEPQDRTGTTEVYALLHNNRYPTTNDISGGLLDLTSLLTEAMPSVVGNSETLLPGTYLVKLTLTVELKEFVPSKAEQGQNGLFGMTVPIISHMTPPNGHNPHPESED